jgi:uncharacterized protein YjbI with pentapeptide repeats
MEILSAYIRDTASRNDPAAAPEPERMGWWGEPAYRPQADVQLALRVLGRLHKEAPSLEQLLDITDRRLLDFKLADLRGANLTMGHYEGSQFHRSDLSEANLSGGYFEAAVFFRAVAPRANFAGDFLGASFAECDLTSVDFHSGQLQGASFENAKLGGASFDGADVRGTDFSLAIFDDKTSFVNAVADENTMWPKGFDGAARLMSEDES